MAAALNFLAAAAMAHQDAGAIEQPPEKAFPPGARLQYWRE
jgi:hypothetical protein